MRQSRSAEKKTGTRPDSSARQPNHGRVQGEEEARSWVGKRGQSAAPAARRDAGGEASGDGSRRVQENLDLFADDPATRRTREGQVNGQGSSGAPAVSGRRPEQTGSVAADLAALAQRADRSPQALVDRFAQALERYPADLWPCASCRPRRPSSEPTLLSPTEISPETSPRKPG